VLVIVATVVLEGAGTLGAELRVGAELRRSDSEVVEDVKGIEEEEGTEELATGEFVEESEGPGSVVVVLALLKTVLSEMHSWKSTNSRSTRRRIRL
jgi:hypothetical protein